jgi:ABC transporter substrate binding protein
MPKVRVVTPAAESDKHKSLDAFENELFNQLDWQGKLDYKVYWSNNDNTQLDGNALNAKNDAPDVIVASGSMAAELLQGRTTTIPVIQAIGGRIPTNLVDTANRNLTGFHIDAQTTCRDQLDQLLALMPAGVVTILWDPTNQPVSTDIKNYITTNYAAQIAAGRINFFAAADPSVLPKYTDLSDRFMLIPSAMFYNNCQLIARAVERKAIPARYPEREYKKAHINKAGRKVYGHSVPMTYRRVARYVDRILDGEIAIGSLPVFDEAARDRDP